MVRAFAHAVVLSQWDEVLAWVRSLVAEIVRALETISDDVCVTFGWRLELA